VFNSAIAGVIAYSPVSGNPDIEGSINALTGRVVFNVLSDNTGGNFDDIRLLVASQPTQSITSENYNGTITNITGLYIEDMSVVIGSSATITNSWGIRQMGANDVNYFNSQTGFGTNTPVSSAKVQIDSTTQGFLLPRMTSAQANLIATPAEGLLIYVTDIGGTPFDFTTKGWWGYDGATWKKLDNL
jgi:hypothetical protein